VKTKAMVAVGFVVGLLVGAVAACIFMGINTRKVMAVFGEARLMEMVSNAALLRQGRGADLLEAYDVAIPSYAVDFAQSDRAYVQGDRRNLALWWVQRYYESNPSAAVPPELQAILDSLPPRPLSAGEKRLQEVGPGPQAGDLAPDFEVETLSGGTIKLSDCRGKYVLLDFWATWCENCIGDIPDLEAVHRLFGEDDRFIMIGLSLDSDMAAPREYVAENEMGWAQGFLGDWSSSPVPGQFGVAGIPQIMLIGPDGRIIARGLRGRAINAAVQEALARE
jgi:thiol-disulfide isomerase/thioredoxin